MILVPGKVISFDEAKNSMTGHWFELRSIFANSDQCLEIEDPLQPILDTIQNDQSALGPDEAYFLRRLPFTVAETDEPSRRLLQTTFAAFKANLRGDQEWINKRIESSLQKRREVFGSAGDVEWEDELASSTGILDSNQIKLIAARFAAEVGEPLQSTQHWIDWGLDWLAEDPARLALVVRPSSVVSALGSSVKGFETDKQKAVAAIATIRRITPLWVAGKPLNEIEQAINSKASEKCESAREWALRFVPELAYYFGLSVQIYLRSRRAIDGQEPKMPLALGKHGRCFREGFDHPDKLALRQVVGGLVPRVVVHRKYSELEAHIEQGTDYESMEDAKRRIRKALKTS